MGYFAPRIAKDIGPAILLIFFGFLVLAGLSVASPRCILCITITDNVPFHSYTYFFIHEVKGLSLEQVDELYKSNTRPWNSSSWQPTLGASRKKAFQRTLYASEQKTLDADRIEAQRSVDAEKDGKATLEMKEHA